VWNADDGNSLLDVKAFYKGFASWLAFPYGLVKETSALQNLEDEAKGALPPNIAAQLPQVPSLPYEAGLTAQSARGQIRFLWKKQLELTAAYEVDATIASASALAGGFGIGATVQGVTSPLASRRLVDFKSVLLQDGGMLITQNLDMLAAKWVLPLGEVVVGRQVLSWGTGRFWNPTDLLSPFAPTQIDRDVRHGIDAVRYSVPFSPTSLLDVLFLPQLKAADQGGAARAQFNAKGFDFSVSFAKYVSDLVAGADFAGDVGPVAVYGEGAYTMGLTGLGTGSVGLANQCRWSASSSCFLRAVAGANWQPVSHLLLMLEYYFNGFGATTPAGYLAKLSDPHVTSGEVFGAGRHYLGVGASWGATDLLTLSGTAIINAQDPSCEIVPAVEWWVEQSVLLRAGGYVPIGRGPNPGPVERLTLTDILTGSPAFLAATSTFGLQSEYGAAPGGLFAQIGVYY
jgi:hypothetical protein